jgi:hypothetical protein
MPEMKRKNDKTAPRLVRQMTEVDARMIAARWVAGQNLRGGVPRFASADRCPASPEVWAVVYDLYTVEGSLMDGPMVVLVNEETGEVSF